MKAQLKLATLLLLSTLNPQPSTVFAQGSLTPPGAPAPTMKTLAQIEPRTPISTASFTISVPGSYYLTTNLTVSTGDAITIATSGVTLDLTGYTISSTAPGATGSGILLMNSLSDITILNGHVKGGVTNNAGTYNGPGFQYGIFYSGTPPMNTRVAGVSVSGCLLSGIQLISSYSTVVESCTVRTVGGNGIRASIIKSSVAVDCGDTAIAGDVVSDSRGECTGSGYGVGASIAQNCSGDSSSNRGLSASRAYNCLGSSHADIGLYAETAVNCSGNSASDYGLFASKTAHNCYGNSASSIGLYAITAQNCYGSSSSGAAGLSAGNASFCTGYRNSGRAIDATVATGCYAAAGTNKVTYKYNMP
jgi:hypothetical protein